MKNKKVIIVTTLMAFVLSTTYVLQRGLLQERAVPEPTDRVSVDSGSTDKDVNLPDKQINSDIEKESQSPKKLLIEKNTDIDTTVAKLQAMMEEGDGLAVEQFRAQERAEFLERLRFKPASIQAFFEQGEASYEEWASAYETEICACNTRTCMKKLQNDYLKFNPPFLDRVQTLAAQKSMHRVIECISTLQ